MTRHPVSDECSVVEERPKWARVERFFCVEIARYLRVSTKRVQQLARQRRMDRYVVINAGPQRERPWMWVNRRDARALIEHFRAMQGETYDEGRDWDEERSRRQAVRRARTERARAKREADKALGGLAALAPAAPNRNG